MTSPKIVQYQQKQDFRSSVDAVVQPCRKSTASRTFPPTKSSQLQHASVRSLSTLLPSNICTDDVREKQNCYESVTVIDVAITEPFENLLQNIEMTAFPFISLLIHHQILMHGQDFRSLGLDVIDFIVKQQRNAFKNTALWKPSEMNILRAAVCVQYLRTAYEQLNCFSLVSACEQLNIWDQDQAIIGDVLNDVQKKLVMEMHRHRWENIVHPKVLQMWKSVEMFFAENSTGEIRKVLIVLPSASASFVRYIFDSSSVVEDLKPIFIRSIETLLHPENLICSTHNCFMIDEAYCVDQFQIQLNYFLLVVEFCFTSKSKWKDWCQNQSNIQFIGLRMTSGERSSDKMTVQNASSLLSSVDVNNLNEDDENERSKRKFSLPLMHKKTNSLVMSQNLISAERELVLLLETRHDVTIIDRDYSSFSSSGYFEDVAIDEASGLIIQNVMKLQNKHEMERLVMRINGLKLKFLVCWIILYSPGEQLNGVASYLHSSITINISKLLASVKVLSSKEFPIKVIFCHSRKSIAEHIQRIAEHVFTEKSSNNQVKLSSVIKAEPTKDEMFLLSFPCLNSISAQLLLSTSSIKDLMAMPKMELLERCHFLHDKFVQAFDKFRTSVGEIYLTLMHAQQGMDYTSDESNSSRKTAENLAITATMKPFVFIGHKGIQSNDEEEEKSEHKANNEEKSSCLGTTEYLTAHKVNEFQQAELFVRNFQKIKPSDSNFNFSNEEDDDDWTALWKINRPADRRESNFGSASYDYSNPFKQKGHMDDFVADPGNCCKYVSDNYLKDRVYSEKPPSISELKSKENLQMTERSKLPLIAKTKTPYFNAIADKSRCLYNKDEILLTNQNNTSVARKRKGNFENVAVNDNSFLIQRTHMPEICGSGNFVNASRICSNSVSNRFNEHSLVQAVHNSSTECCNFNFSQPEFDKQGVYSLREKNQSLNLPENSYSCLMNQSGRKSQQSLVPDDCMISSAVKMQRPFHQEPSLVKFYHNKTSWMAHECKEQAVEPWVFNQKQTYQKTFDFSYTYCKKQKLVFEKDETSKSGQTKLKFI